MAQLGQYCPMASYYSVNDSTRIHPAHQVYTGVLGVDYTLCALTSFFIESMKPEVLDTTLYVILEMPSVVMFTFVENMRGRSDDSLLPSIAPMLVGLAYQRLGGGLILPMYWIYLVLSNVGGMKSQKRMANRPAASMLIALIVGFYLPTYLMFATADPFWTAFWQPFPLLLFLSQFATLLTLPKLPSVSGPKIIQALYGLTFVVSATTHIYLLGRAQGDLVKQFADIFIPIPKVIETTVPLTAKNFLQWDGLFIFGSLAVFSLRFARNIQQLIGLVLMHTIGSVLLGPGSAIALVMIWREAKLAHGWEEKASKRI